MLVTVMFKFIVFYNKNIVEFWYLCLFDISINQSVIPLTANDQWLIKQIKRPYKTKTTAATSGANNKKYESYKSLTRGRGWSSNTH